MNKTIIKLSLAVFAIGFTNMLYAQDEPKEENVRKEILNWYNGGGTGMYTEKAYKKLKGRKSSTVVVAIIDSGMDIEHVDLKGKIWVNEDEIPANGIDDDNNGYIDDVHGWNFLGNSKGENANDIRLEMTRIYAELSKKYGEQPITLTSDEEIAEYELYVEVKKEVESKREYAEMVLGMIGKRMDGASGDQKASLERAKEYFESQLDVLYNPDFNGRELVGDDPDDFSDVNYGNNDVEGPDAFHGTHVGGIVGAIRGNGIGGDGVAHDVKLMSVRAVPNGDEFDKDVALAIRYAVDNGAQVINMSFGKAYSPHAEKVYEAFQYADSKGVLLVHAAGNDGKDIDEEPNFPTSMYSFQEEKLDHFLTIGASTRFGDKVPFKNIQKKMMKAGAKGKTKAIEELSYKMSIMGNDLPASFSNFGKKGVDVFAPGLEIYNSVPQSDYAAIQGTSMACPMVAGAAAFLKSYFPSLSMKEVKEILLASATVYKGESVVAPGGDAGNVSTSADMVDFGNLSVTGGVINLYEAVELCLEKEN